MRARARLRARAWPRTRARGGEGGVAFCAGGGKAPIDSIETEFCPNDFQFMNRKKIAPEREPVSSVEPEAAPGSELFWESKVAESLGVARERIAALRNERLTEGVHFRMVRNAVVLTARGLEIIASALRPGAASPAPAPSPDNITPGLPAAGICAGRPARVSMLVLRVPANIRVLLCSRKNVSTRTESVVRVRDNRLFMPGMVLEAIDGGRDGLQFTGRLPRRKGRW